MAIDAATLKNELDAAKTHISNSAWAKAETDLLKAWTTRSALADGQDGDKQWSLPSHRTIERLLAHVRRQKQASANKATGGLKVSNVDYEPASKD